MTSNTPDLEALKEALEAAKIVHRDAAKAVLDAKRVADRTHFRVTEARRAYNIARRPMVRPRPKRNLRRKVRSVFPDDDDEAA